MQMFKERRWQVAVLLVLIMFLLAGCGGGASGGTLENVASGAVDAVVRFMPRISLPRITVEYDDTGIPAIFGVKTTSITRLVPLNLSFVELPADTLQFLRDKNIQHVEVDVNEAGLFVYVNGKVMPYVAWSEDGLRSAGDLLDRLDMVPYDTTIAKALPLLGRLGINVVVKFPLADGETAIPVHDRSERLLAELVPIDEPTAVIHGVVEYSDEGVPSIAGISSREIAELAKTDLSSVELQPANLALVKQADIDRVAAVAKTDGLHLAVNEQELVHLAYNEQHLNNAIELYAQIAGDERGEFFATLLRNLVPILSGADIDLAAQFPDSE